MKNKDIQNSKTFCIHPFVGLVTREDGAIKPCCRSQPTGWIQNESLEESWNNENIKLLRKKVLNNERPFECNSCFMLEDQGVESLRTLHNNTEFVESKLKKFRNRLDDLKDDYSMPFEFPNLEIKLNNLCNLKCRMCSPLDSTSWNDWTEIEDFYKKENNYLYETVNELGLNKSKYINFFDKNWWDSFHKIIPYLELIEFGGGEPLMDPQHYEILEILKPYAKNIEIKYATNGTKIGITKDRTIENYWPNFKSVKVNVSIDGIHNVYEYIRTNSTFSVVEENIKIMKTIPTVSHIVGKFTVQAANVLQMSDCVKYFIEEMAIPFYSHRVSYPNLLSAQVLPNELKKIAIGRLENLLEEIPNFKNLTLFNIDLDKITVDNINDTIQYLNGHDQSDKFKDFLEFNKRLDIKRKQGPIELIIPEFAKYV